MFMDDIATEAGQAGVSSNQDGLSERFRFWLTHSSCRLSHSDSLMIRSIDICWRTIVDVLLYSEVVGHSYPMMLDRPHFLQEIDGIEPVELIFVVVSHEWKIQRHGVCQLDNPWL